jgi:hypothetical protein
MISGPAIMHWVITSGGVRMAAITKVNNIAYFLFCFKNSGVTAPIFVRKKTFQYIQGAREAAPLALFLLKGVVSFSPLQG